MDIQLTDNIEKKLSKNWKRRYKVLKREKQKMDMTVAHSFAGDVIYRWMTKYRSVLSAKRKMKGIKPKDPKSHSSTQDERRHGNDKEMEEISSGRKRLKM